LGDKTTKTNNIEKNRLAPQMKFPLYFNTFQQIFCSASSTYKNLGRVYRRSALGQDNMVITFSGGADQHLKQIEFGVNGDADDCYSDYNARLSLAHSTPKINNSFLESIFAHEKEPVAVVTFYK
jgi:hypothetical protein